MNLYGKDKWALSTYSRNCSLIENYIEPLMVSSGGEDISTINTGAKQEEMNYQEMQERFLQNMMKTYMMIESVGHMK